MANLIDFLRNVERDQREGILIRYDNSIKISESLISLFNATEKWNIVCINKNDSEHIFIASANGKSYQINASYCQENDWYELKQISEYTQLGNNMIIEKAMHYSVDTAIILKPIEKKLMAPNAQSYTYTICLEIAKLKSYDMMIEEERQAEIERKSIEEQLEMWNLCIEAEMKLLVDTPFECNGLPQIIKRKNAAYIDIPISPYIVEDGEHTLLEVQKCLNDNTIEQDKDNHYCLSYKQLKELTEVGVTISEIENCIITIGCDASYKANLFKKQYRGYRISYDPNVGYNIVKLTINDISFLQLEQLLKDINKSLYFTDTITEDDIICNGVSIISHREETKMERARRIELLDGKEMLWGKYFIGTLDSEGCDFSQLRISMPKEKEVQNKIVDDLKPLIESRKLSKGLITPNLIKERTILTRERDAVSKVRDGRCLKNERLKEFIFNSSKAIPTNRFINKEIEETKEFDECQKSALLPLNSSQQSAVVKALFAEDLCLLQGPPGTGKTTVIAELLWQHIRMKQDVRVMLTSQTNLAIDNALSRLLSEFASSKDSNMWRYKTLIKPLRIADAEKLSEEGMPFTSDRIDNWVKNGSDEDSKHNVICYWMANIADRINMPEQIDADSKVLQEWKKSLGEPDSFMRKVFADAYKESYNIMGMTCGKIDSPDFRNNRGTEGFDVVIMDEASKCTPPELIMPLCYAKKSIIIGDHRQLPPVMYSSDFREKLLSLENVRAKYLADKLNPEQIETSLFKRLIINRKISPTIKATFNWQYRMHPQINDVIEQFYSNDPGGLHCGLSQTKINSPSFDERESRYHGFVLPGIIDSQRHVLWIDVPNGYEKRDAMSFYNEEEVKTVEAFLLALQNAIGYKEYFDYWKNCDNIERSITEGQIGIISFYAPQVEKLKRRMQSLKARFDISTRTDSVDNFQGQERGIVIVSTVRTNNAGFTRSPERLNVALSRARRLLVVVGNSQFFSSVKDKDGNYIYRNVIDKIKQNGGFISSKEVERYVI